MGRRSAAALVAVALCAAVSAAGMRAVAVQAAFPQGTIITQTGVVGAGVALAVAQGAFSVAYTSTGHLLVGDATNAVVRDFDGAVTESVLAGNNAYGYRGDGGLATAAMINGAGAIVNCGPGLTYFADTANDVIRKVDAGGVITTVAGTGTPGYSGDGGPATAAQLNTPLGLACRTGGGLYISDSFNGRIRILDASGNITSWWSGFFFPSGLVEVGGQNVVDVSETGFNAVWQLTNGSASVIAGDGTNGIAGSSGDSGAATSARLNAPTGLAYDAANQELYIADTLNNEVRRVAFGLIIRLAGQAPPAAAGFGGDNGPPTLATLNQPVGLALNGVRSGGLDSLYIADSLNYRVRKIETSGGQNAMTTVAGNGSPSWSGDGGQASLAQLGNPFGVAFDGAGNEYISDNQDNVIREIAVGGVISTVAGNAIQPPGYSGDGGPAINANLNSPRGIAVNVAGDIAIADTGNHRVRWVDHISHNITTLAGTGAGGNNGNGTPATSFMLNFPRGVAIDGSGNVFIADSGNNRIQEVIGTTMSTYAGSAIGTAGSTGDGGAAIAALFNAPRALAFDGSGNLFVSDANNNKVRRIAAGGGLVSTFAGNGTVGLAGDLHLAPAAELNHPFGLAIDGSGRLFIADTGNQRIRMVDANGIITSVVATCTVIAGFAGDNGPAAIAQLNSPFGIAVNAAGNLYIADVNSNRVRQAFALASVRSSVVCPSASAPAQNGRSIPTQTGNTPPGGLRIPWTERSAASATGLAIVPGLAASPRLRMVGAAPPAAAPPAAAAAPAAAQPAPIAAVPAQPETSVQAPSAAVVPPARRAGAMVAPSRATATAVENPSLTPVVVAVVVIALAIAVISLLAVRRRKNRRLIGHTTP